ncbi:MAG: hypothetical protein AAB113_01060, partial [Candidatus Eisenbacteria bacterium]
DGYARPEATASLARLAATGANTVAILVTAYQSDASASEIRTDDPRTPTPTAVAQTVRAAAALGLDVLLKPHVDVDDGSWRGRIDPADPERWFASYAAFVREWAALAESSGVDAFVVGTELASTIRHETRWRETVRAARECFRGALIYAASWDEAAKVPFWDALDLVGVDFYFPVAGRRDAGRLELLAGWQPWLERLHLLHRQTGRDILLTEIGYRSVDGAGMAPYAFGSGAALDLGEQADLYWAALQATGDQHWIRGLYWWNWPADGSGGPRNTDFTPADKPAAGELTAAWGRS